MLTLKSIGVATVLTVSIAMPATAAAQGQDLRNADQRTPAVQAAPQDLRNADRRVPAPPATSGQDLRNADRRGPVSVEPVRVDVPTVTTIESPRQGFDWGDAGIGAAGGIAVLALLAGLTMAAAHRRRGPHVPA